MGIAGVVKKETVDNKWEFFPDFKTGMGHVRMWRNDYSLVPDPREGFCCLVFLLLLCTVLIFITCKSRLLNFAV